MNESNTHPIWSPETGIKDIQEDTAALSASEIPGIKAVWADQRGRLSGTIQLSEFTEKLSREWAIETGIIENLYDIERGVTQTLIERGFHAELLSHGSIDKPREYVLQLLRDQKNALDGIFDFVKSQRNFSTSYIKELHAALLRSQDVTEGIDASGNYMEVPLIKGTWKIHANYPVRDGVIYLYCPPEQVASEMDRLVHMHVEHNRRSVPSEVQAAWLHHRFTQIHPFQDGNGRVARAIASLVLVKDGLFPFVVTRDDKPRYLDSLEAADNGNLRPLVELIAKLQIAQFRKASAISESILAQDDVQSALSGLSRAADRIATENLRSLRSVFDLASVLERDLEVRLESISSGVLTALRKVKDNASVNVYRSTSQNDHYFRAQIIDNAKKNFDYFADTSEYRSWISLNMRWTRRAQLIFAFHGIGKPFNGSLICAPFLEFKDSDDDGQLRTQFVPVAEDGFVFFYNEDKERLLSRFRPWREDALKVTVKELSRNL